MTAASATVRNAAPSTTRPGLTSARNRVLPQIPCRPPRTRPWAPRTSVAAPEPVRVFLQYFGPTLIGGDAVSEHAMTAREPPPAGRRVAVAEPGEPICPNCGSPHRVVDASRMEEHCGECGLV